MLANNVGSWCEDKDKSIKFIQQLINHQAGINQYIKVK